MTTIRAIKRVSEEYITDGKTGLYYWLAPVYKRGTDQQLLDDMDVMVKKLSKLPRQGEQVLRPTAMIHKSVMSKINADVRSTLAKNTYLMLFDSGAPEPIDMNKSVMWGWGTLGNGIFVWSDNDTVYTWCVPNQLGYRYHRVPAEEALANAFEDIPSPGGEVVILPPVVSARKWHITGNAGLLGKIDITVEAE